MEPVRAKAINMVVGITVERLKQNISHFEWMAKSDVSKWSTDDAFDARGVILCLLSLVRGNMIRYLPEDGSDILEDAASRPEIRRARSSALTKLMESASLLTEIAGRDPEIPLTTKERNLMSAAVFAFLMLVTEGSVTE